MNRGLLLTRLRTGTGGDVGIPETIDGVPVTAIKRFAFEGRTDVTSVEIASTVVPIGEEKRPI